MIIEFEIETVELDVALKINNSLVDDYNINLYDISFPSKEVYNNKEKLYVIIKEKDLFLDIVNAIKNVFIENKTIIHNINMNFTSELIKMLIRDNNLDEFFKTVDLYFYDKSEIIEIIENEMSIDDLLDKISLNNRISNRDKQLIQLKN